MSLLEHVSTTRYRWSALAHRSSSSRILGYTSSDTLQKCQQYWEWLSWSDFLDYQRESAWIGGPSKSLQHLSFRIAAYHLTFSSSSQSLQWRNVSICCLCPEIHWLCFWQNFHVSCLWSSSLSNSCHLIFLLPLFSDARWLHPLQSFQDLKEKWVAMWPVVQAEAYSCTDSGHFARWHTWTLLFWIWLLETRN